MCGNVGGRWRCVCERRVCPTAEQLHFATVSHCEEAARLGRHTTSSSSSSSSTTTTTTKTPSHCEDRQGAYNIIIIIRATLFLSLSLSHTHTHKYTPLHVFEHND